ncbi:MAG: YybS family protein [Actinobacteria bacterium]|nr:YybS family protein [Actinomycetota bacterium]
MSFDNINNVNQQKSNLFKLILLTVLAYIVLIVSVFIPFIGIIGLALISIPSIKLMLEGRKWESILCALIGSFVLFFIDWTMPVFFFVFVICTALVYLYCFKRGKSPFFIITLNSILFIALIILYILAVSFARQENLIISFLNNYKTVINNFPADPLVKQYMQIMAISETQFKTLYEQSKNIFLMLPYLIPGLLLIYIFFSSLINYYWCASIFKKSSLILRSMPLFKTWDLPWYYVAGIITGLILIVIPYFNVSYNFILNAVGINLLIVFGAFYSVLGFSVAWGIFDKFNVALIWRVLIILLISFFLILIVVIPIMGILDVWINFRKLERH